MALTKTGTGAGSLLVINSTLATLANVAVLQTAPVKYTVAPASTPTGVTIIDMQSLTIPEMKWSFDNVTNLNSPAAGVGVIQENLPTTVDLGELTATGVYIPGDPGLGLMQQAFNSGVAQNFQIQLPPLGNQSNVGNVIAFTGFVSSLPYPSEVSFDKTPKVKVTIKLASLFTNVAGS